MPPMTHPFRTRTAIRAAVWCGCGLLGAVPIPAFGWLGPYNLTGDHNPADGDYGPDLHVDAAGTLHLTYMGMYDGKWRMFYRNKTAGGSWSSVYTIKTGNSSDPYSPHSFMDNAGNLHVVWSVGGNVGYGLAGTDVFYVKRAANGTWSGITNISNTNNAASLSPDLVVDSLGRVFVAWHEYYDGSQWEIGFRWFDGTTWQPALTALPERLNNDAAIDNTVALGIDTANTVHLLWTTYDEIFYRTRSSVGAWSGITNLSNNSGSSRDPRMHVQPDGTVHVVWHDEMLGDWEFFYRTRVGGVWQGIVNLSNNAAETDCYGAVAAESDGSVDTVWQDYTRLYYNRRSGSVWSGPIILASGDVGRGNCLLVAPNGRHHIVYEQGGDLWERINDIPDQTPPGQVTNASAVGYNTRVRVSWRNPADFDFSRTLVRAKAGGPPTGPTDGIFVCEPAGGPDTHKNCDHTGATNGTLYYYGVFARDQAGNYAAPVIVSATPAGPGDIDRDGDVDMSDFARLQACLTGPAIEQTDPACADARLDYDGSFHGDKDVDADDIVVFMGCVSGAGLPADPECYP